MGVIAIDEDGEVWGAASSFIHSMLLDFERVTGGREYLTKFNKQFEYAYNSIGLSELDDEQLLEFLELVRQYISKRGYKAYAQDEESLRKIDDMMFDLVDKIEESLARRRSKADGSG